MQELKEKLLQKIISGEVAMRPRWHFILTSVLALTGIGILLMGLVYLLSFIAFALRETGVMFVPFLGPRGMLSFVMASPWLLVLFAFIFIVSLEVLVRKYSFAYRSPFLYSVIGIVVVSLLGTVLIMQTSFHARMHDAAVRNQLPMVMPIYERYAGQRPDDMYVGTIRAISIETMVIVTPLGEEVTVRIDSKTKLPRQRGLRVGDLVMLIGQRNDDGVVQAFGVRLFTEESGVERRVLRSRADSELNR